MKNCVWVKPELVVQIEFDEWTPDGHTCGIQGLSDCVRIKIPAKLGGNPEKINAIAALAMACVAAIQKGRVVNVAIGHLVEKNKSQPSIRVLT